jgi:hypothetical protein
MRGGPTEIAGVQLMQNEAVLEDVNPAWSAYVGSLLFGVLLLLAALAEATFVDNQNDAGATVIMGIVVFGVIFGYAAYRRYRTHYIVTDSRVIKRTGIMLNSSTEEAGYEMITGVGVDASRFQSLFGNGTVNVATSGGVGTIELAGAPGAQDLANLIRERHPALGARGRGGPAGGPPAGGQPQGRGAPQGGRGQPRGGQPQGRGAGQSPQGDGRRQRGESRQGGQPRDVDGARGAEGPRQRDGQPTNQPRQGGQRGGQPQGRGEPSKRERRQQRADDERRSEEHRRDERRGESGRNDRDRRSGERTPESDGPVDRTPSSGGDPVGEDAGDRRPAGGDRDERTRDAPSDERRRREDGDDEDDEDGPAWDPDGR